MFAALRMFRESYNGKAICALIKVSNVAVQQYAYNAGPLKHNSKC